MKKIFVVGLVALLLALPHFASAQADEILPTQGQTLKMETSCEEWEGKIEKASGIGYIAQIFEMEVKKFSQQNSAPAITIMMTNLRVVGGGNSFIVKNPFLATSLKQGQKMDIFISPYLGNFLIFPKSGGCEIIPLG